MTWLLVLLACMPADYRRARKLEGKYETGQPGQGWVQVDPGDADHAWFNKALGATVYTDSNCGPRYAESLSANLATELTAGLRGVTTDRDDILYVLGREGVLRVHTGTLDGVAVRLALGVVNVDACNYDFTLIAPPEQFDAGLSAWQAVVDGFAPR